MNTDRQLIHTLRDKLGARQSALSSRIHSSEISDKEFKRLTARYYAIRNNSDLLIKNEMVDILNNDLFEIYTYNTEPLKDGVYAGSPAGAISGWEIKWILAPNREAIKKYPFFDCIISRNDNSTGQARSAELFTP